VSAPRLLDLFCGAGGAAMGYHRAGFEVLGVDIKPQPRYPFEFHQADAMEFPLDGFDVIHASPPCQGYSRLRHLPWLKGREYPMLIDPIRERLRAAGVPWAIENVEDAPLLRHHGGVIICPAAIGAGDYWRHRKFESNMALLAPPCPGKRAHRVIAPGHASLAKRGGVQDGRYWSRLDGAERVPAQGSVEAAASMGIDWMTREELAQAIPPAYTEFIGEQLMAMLERVP